jgi:hypothetical protein
VVQDLVDVNDVERAVGVAEVEKIRRLEAQIVRDVSPGSSSFDHIRGCVDSDHPARSDETSQFPGDPALAATNVKQRCAGLKQREQMARRVSRRPAPMRPEDHVRMTMDVNAHTGILDTAAYCPASQVGSG